MEQETSKVQPNPPILDELIERYGPIVAMWETAFTDGRKIALCQFERTYLLCAENPNQPPEFRHMVTNLSPESLIGFQILYMCAGMEKQKADRAKFRELLDRKGQETFAPIMEAMEDVGAGEVPLWPMEKSGQL